MDRLRRVGSVVDGLAVRAARYAFVIGGGGKTTLIAALARELGQEQLVIVTTSTKIRCPLPGVAEAPIVCEEIAAVVALLRARRGRRGVLNVAHHALVAEGKLAGFATEELDRLLDAGVAGCVLVEADGSAGRSLKAHATHEPVVSPRADLLIAVIGVDCIGQPLTDEHVHRAGRASAWLGKPAGEPLSIDDVVAIFFHPEGYLRTVDPRTPVAVLLAKARGDTARARGRQLAQQLYAADRDHRISRIVLGELVGGVELELVPR